MNTSRSIEEIEGDPRRVLGRAAIGRPYLVTLFHSEVHNRPHRLKKHDGTWTS
jgi:hypothetical protein